jgi:hydroxypyruvate isomerase
MFNEVQPVERLASARAAGFQAVEMQFPYAQELAELAAARQAADVEFVLMNIPAGRFAEGERGIAGLPERRGEYLESVNSAIEYAHALGCRRLNCLAGNLPQPEAREACLQMLVENVAMTADMLAARGMELLLEPLNRTDNPSFILGTLEEADALITLTGKSNIRIQYDTYHCRLAGGNWLAQLEKFIGRIGHIQFSDFPGRGEPGTGTLDFSAFFELVRRLPYNGWVGAEYMPSGRTEESLNWLAASAIGRPP